MEGIYLETTFLCMYTLLYKHQKIWNEAQYTLNFESFGHKSASVFLIQVYIFPFIEYNWIVFQYIIKVKSQMDLEKELVLHLQVLLFLLIEFEWINYLLSPLKATEIHLWLYDDFSGNKSLLIRTNLLKIKSKIWQ